MPSRKLTIKDRFEWTVIRLDQAFRKPAKFNPGAESVAKIICSRFQTAVRQRSLQGIRLQAGRLRYKQKRPCQPPFPCGPRMVNRFLRKARLLLCDNTYNTAAIETLPSCGQTPDYLFGLWLVWSSDQARNDANAPYTASCSSVPLRYFQSHPAMLPVLISIFNNVRDPGFVPRFRTD